MSFEHFYQSFFARVYNYARYHTSSDSEAEDLTAAIFEKCYRRFEDYQEGKASLAVWTFTIARSVTVDFFRRKKIRAFFALTEAKEEQLASDQNILAELEKSEEEKFLSLALSQLSHRERELLNLHFFQRFKQAEIAEITGMTQSYVGVLLHRSVQKLKQYMERNYGSTSPKK